MTMNILNDLTSIIWFSIYNNLNEILRFSKNTITHKFSCIFHTYVNYLFECIN